MSHKSLCFDSVKDALLYLKNGGMLVVVDDENRENEGDLICSASQVTPEQINFMATFGRGLICLALPSAQVSRLNLPLMVRTRGAQDAFNTAFTYSIDAKEGITTGISTADRALTISLAVDPCTREDQLSVPGHVFPLRSRDGGVFMRRGHTEAAVDLTRLADLNPGGVICEILNQDGSMMRLPDLILFAKHHKLPLISIQDLVQYRLDTEIVAMCQTSLPTPNTTLQQRVYQDSQGAEHVLLWKGDFSKEQSPLTRIHSECLTGDVFESSRCDCGSQLRKSLDLIIQEGSGILMYLRQEGRGIGLTNKIKAYALQDQGLDTVEANKALGHEVDLRSYEVALKMLCDLRVKNVRLLTNNPLKVHYLEQHQIKVTRLPLLVVPTCHNEHYQQTKALKLGHYIPLVENL